LIRKGLWICFEGLDGSGKGTMLSLTAEFLFNNFKEFDIILTREPTFSAFGKQIRKLLLEDKTPMSNAKQLLQLYLDDRKEHLEKVIKPALQKNSIVLCDRYKYSTIVYQQAQGIEVEKIINLHERMLVPDITFILDVSPQTALKRIKEQRSSLEKFEKEFFLEELRQNYLELPKLLPNENLKIIKAEKSKEEVFKEIKRELIKILNKK
jgi:dTMP kinase